MSGRTVIIYSDELAHYGVPGQKWGTRNYQNEDGSYKPGAEGRYYAPVGGSEARKEIRNRYIKLNRRQSRKIEEKYGKKWEENESKYKKELKDLKKNYKEEMKKAGGLSDKQKVAIAAGAAVAALAVAAYAMYKVSKNNSNALSSEYEKIRKQGMDYLEKSIANAKSNKASTADYYTMDMRVPDLAEKFDKNIYNRLKKQSSFDLPEFATGVHYKNDNGYESVRYDYENVKKLIKTSKR